jgi:hypothetical protein
MVELARMLEIEPTPRSWSANPHAHEREMDSGPLYDRIVRSGLDGQRVSVLYKFGLDELEWERMRSICVHDKDVFTLQVCSFLVSDVNARLEVRVDKHGCKPTVYLRMPSEPSKKRRDDLTSAIERVSGLSLE